MSADVLICCEDVGKKFCRDLKKSLFYGLSDSIADLVRIGAADRHLSSTAKLRDLEFWANDGVSFELRRGECLGLIGHNGAGKTTLLKLLNGLIKPDYGRVEIRGNVGSLIALGAGFNPILTGRENIYVNGSILGLSRKQINSRLDEIVDFSELAPFIDSPVRSYSSGMQVRLGFAIAAVMIQPDVLLLDEVLAVGDAGFRLKCYNAVMEMANRAAVVIVSHMMPQIARLSTQIMLLDHGKVVLRSDDLGAVIQKYFDITSVETRFSTSGDEAKIRAVHHGDARVPQGGTLIVDQKQNVLLEFELQTVSSVENAVLILGFYDRESKNVARTDCVLTGICSGDSTVEVHIPQLPLVPGYYGMQLIFCDATDSRRPRHLVRHDIFCEVSIRTSAISEYACVCPVLFDSEAAPDRCGVAR